MRRKDREIQNKTEVLDVLMRLDTVRIGIQGHPYPYVVPVSFGLDMIRDQAIIYFHCAPQGMKVDLLRENPHVCIEADRLICIEETAHGITARYESVIGFGKCQLLTDMDEIRHGLHMILHHYGYDDYSLDRCMNMHHLLVGKIVVDQISGKRNLPEK